MYMSLACGLIFEMGNEWNVWQITNKYANFRFLELVGYSLEDMQREGLCFFDKVLFEKDADIFRATIERFNKIEGGDKISNIFRVMINATEYKWVTGNYNIFTGAVKGAPMQIIYSGSVHNNFSIAPDLWSDFVRENAHVLHKKIWDTLSKKNILLLRCICEGIPSKLIADRMGCTKDAVDGCRKRLYGKLKVKTEAGIILFAVKIGVF